MTPRTARSLLRPIAALLCSLPLASRAQQPVAPASPVATPPGASQGKTTANTPQAPSARPAQNLPNLPGISTPALPQASGAPANTPPPTGPLSLSQALSRAQTNQPAFASASAASRIALLDRSIARAALLPTLTYHNQFLYTEGSGLDQKLNQNGTAAAAGAPRFIANNTVHEYTSQGVATETIGALQFNAISRATANAAVAGAELELARRGLVSTIATLFYGAVAADHKLSIAERAATEARNFTNLTQQREQAREGARADVVKAQLQQQQRERDLADARVQAQKARIELAVLLFPDPLTPYALEVPAAPPSLPSRAEIQAAATLNNPELRSAAASLRVSALELTAARLAYVPDLSLNYTYGLDAPQFAVHSPDGTRNLGYSASATLDIPVWDWFSTQRRVKQSEIRRDLAKLTLTAAQRRIIAQIEESYAEAAAARDQLASLDLSVTTAAESLRLTRLRYTAGEATVLEIVDAQNSLTTAELAREDGAVRLQTALSDLQTLTGTL